MKVCKECSSSFQCFLDCIHSYIPRSVSSLFLIMDEYVRLICLPCLTFRRTDFSWCLFHSCIRGCQAQMNQCRGTREWQWEHVSYYVLLGLKTLGVEKSEEISSSWETHFKILNRIISESSIGLIQDSLLVWGFFF